MAIERRKDDKKRVLKEGEYQRANGTFEYKWRDKKVNVILYTQRPWMN